MRLRAEALITDEQTLPVMQTSTNTPSSRGAKPSDTKQAPASFGQSAGAAKLLILCFYSTSCFTQSLVFRHCDALTV